jgi:hypothetical protein
MATRVERQPAEIRYMLLTEHIPHAGNARYDHAVAGQWAGKPSVPARSI